MTKRLTSLLTIFALYFVPMLALGQGFNPSDGISDANLSDASLYSIATNLMRYLLMLITILAVIGFVGSGIFYVTSGGNSDRVKTATSWLQYSVIGIIVALIGYIVINLIDSLLRAEVQR